MSRGERLCEDWFWHFEFSRKWFGSKGAMDKVSADWHDCTTVRMCIQVKSTALGYQDAKHGAMRHIHTGMFETNAN